MLNDFEQYLHERYQSGKARKERWYWKQYPARPKYRSQRKLAMETCCGVVPVC